MSSGHDTIKLSPSFAAKANWFLGLGILGFAGCIAGYFTDKKSFFASYLTAFVFFLALSLGAVFFVMVQHVARSAWSVSVRRIAETFAGNLRIMGLLILPLLAGVSVLFPWWDAEVRATDHLLHAKEAYLNPTFFFIRLAVYIVSWFILGHWFLKTSLVQDQSKDPSLSLKMGKWACLGLAVYALSQTFFAFDWMMSLEPHWFSTMFGVYFFAGSVVLQYAMLIIMSSVLRGTGHLRDHILVDHYHDMGKLLFGHNVFWTYIGYSQFMLIWYANIPEETGFFLHRSEGSWKIISLILPWGHFAIPFLFLLSHNIKRRAAFLTAGATWLVVMCFIDIYWLIQPNFHHHGAHFGWMDISSIAGVGGIFAWFFIRNLAKNPLVAVGDPRLQECLHYDNNVVD